MGLFDRIHPVDDASATAAGLVCAAGHAIRDLQTKSLESRMDTYWVSEQRLWVQEMGDLQDRQHTEHWSRDDDRLHRVVHEAYPPAAITAIIRCYGHCKQCAPVMVRYTGTLGSHLLRERYPRVEYEIEVQDGGILETTPIQLESRADVIAELERHGVAFVREEPPPGGECQETKGR